MKVVIGTIAIVAVALLFCDGCAKRQTIEPAPTWPTEEAPLPAQEPEDGFALGSTPLPSEGESESIYVPFRESVYFDFDRASLRGEACLLLDQLAMEVVGRDVTVYGACCWIGPDGYNYDLGERRARAVREYLASQGVPRGSIITESWGETRLATTAAERIALNRRCEIVVE